VDSNPCHHHGLVWEGFHLFVVGDLVLFRLFLLLGIFLSEEVAQDSSLEVEVERSHCLSRGQLVEEMEADFGRTCYRQCMT